MVAEKGDSQVLLLLWPCQILALPESVGLPDGSVLLSGWKAGSAVVILQ